MVSRSDGGPPPLTAQTATRVFLRPIASPFALGFIGLAGASVTVAGASTRSPGTLAYQCSIHPSMTGTLEVTP